MCRFGRQSLIELLGRRPEPLELALFEKALADILDKEYAVTPRELARHED